MPAFFPLTDSDKKDMLKAIGVDSVDTLLSCIPSDVPRPKITLPEPMSEYALKRSIVERLDVVDALSFLGAGVYDHYIPAIVDHLSSRGEFFTAYTPYQAEASQGTLQAIYEYQSMIASLTGLDVATASHYDGATSLAESVIISLNQTRRKKVLVAPTVHPEYRCVLNTYLSAYDCEIVTLPLRDDGLLDGEALTSLLTREVASLVVQSPNFFGLIEDMRGVREMLDSVGALLVVVANPLSLGVLRAPGSYGADIVCGDGQVFGNPQSFGGPHLGYIASTKKLMRSMPGRLAGMTEDSDGKRAFVLTLQAREQHIRRQRAASNICSNQALCALRACIYLAAVGHNGLKRIGEINVQNTAYMKDKLIATKQFELVFDGPVFNEFVLKSHKPLGPVLKKCQKAGIHLGVPVAQWYPQMKDCLLICVTETKTKNDIDHVIKNITH